MDTDAMREKLKQFDERMALLAEKEKEALAQEADKLRQEYLKRTGRKDLTP